MKFSLLINFNKKIILNNFTYIVGVSKIFQGLKRMRDK